MKLVSQTGRKSGSILEIVDILEMADTWRQPGITRKDKVEDLGILYIIAAIFFFGGMLYDHRPISNLCHLISIVAAVIMLIAYLVQHDTSVIIAPIIFIIINLGSLVIKRL